MNKRRIISLALALAISTGLLSGCANQTQADVSEDTVVMDVVQTETKNEVSVVDDSTYTIDNFDEVPESKEFDAGEHVFMIRYDILDELGYRNSESVNSLSITVPEGYSILNMENFIGLGGKIGTIVVLKGGDTRNDTIINSINYIKENFDIDDDSIIVTHDSVRPFVTHRIIEDNINAAIEFGACDTVVPATDTIVESVDGEIIKDIPLRDNFYQGQTPQSFKINKLYSINEHTVSKQ